MALTLQIIEPIISISVIIFGILFIYPNILSLKSTMLTVALFAIVHGYAHGKEMPIFVLPEIYILGFMVSTTLIHVAGVLFGEKVNQLPDKQMISKFTGLFLIVAGFSLLAIQILKITG